MGYEPRRKGFSMTEEIKEVKKVKVKFQDYKHCGTERWADCFFEAIDEEIAQGHIVTAIIPKIRWTNYIARWIFRRDCRILIT